MSFPLQVCATILKDHHANLWDGGENPLYFQKVKEMEKGNFVPEKTMADISGGQMASSALISDKSMSCVSSKDTTSNSHSTLELEDHENSTKSYLGQNSDIEPPNKKQKGDIIYNQMQSSNPLAGKNVLVTFSKNYQSEAFSIGEEISQLENNVTDIPGSNKDTATTRESQLTGAFDSHKNPCEETSEGNSQSQGQTLANLCPDSRPGFEMSQWTIDTSCDLCKKLPIEPRERDMVMFLHAMKYKVSVLWLVCLHIYVSLQVMIRTILNILKAIDNK